MRANPFTINSRNDLKLNALWIKFVNDCLMLTIVYVISLEPTIALSFLRLNQWCSHYNIIITYYNASWTEWNLFFKVCIVIVWYTGSPEAMFEYLQYIDLSRPPTQDGFFADYEKPERGLNLEKGYFGTQPSLYLGVRCFEGIL